MLNTLFEEAKERKAKKQAEKDASKAKDGSAAASSDVQMQQQ